MIRYPPRSYIHILRTEAFTWLVQFWIHYLKGSKLGVKERLRKTSTSKLKFYPVGKLPCQLLLHWVLITFTVNALLHASCVISFPRDDGLLSSLQLPSKAHSISISVIMWMFISWINYCLTFPLSQPYFYYSCIPIFQLIKRKEEYSWYLHKAIKSSIPCRILILKPLPLMLSSNWHFCFSPNIIQQQHKPACAGR